MPRFSYRRMIRSISRGAMRYAFGKRGERRIQGWRLLYRVRLASLLYVDEPITRLARRTEVRLWVDGGEAFQRLEKLLSRARHTIFIQMFIWKDDELGKKIASILIEAADRGVHVDINKEAVGDFFEMSGDFLTTKNMHDPVWHRFWNHRRIKIAHTTMNDHAKVFVIDDQILLLTGMNIANEYRDSWHDYLVELRGSRFVQQYLTEGMTTPNDPVRLYLNTVDVKQIRPAVMHLLRGAQSSVLLEQCYLSDTEVIDELVQLSKRGVRVTLILPESQDLHYHANRQALGRVLMEGDASMIQVFLYPGIVHGKVILVDRTKMFLGSANMMQSSIDEMGELNVLIEGKYRIALMKLREVLRQDILKSKLLTTPPQFRWLGRWLASLGL
ncbi:MAG TPA: phosphatidylserine/phosphatidylglycerophosphate/cardiolipin synthase family protein [Candidatus Peribacteraceae bacterium]|nr:phosphatidylserine/phosphatidylglycerophosphate/cardiolipin synthase family protein [Candidatus Peribacteraceae bacterium]